MAVTLPCHDCGSPVRSAASPHRWLCGTCSTAPPRAVPREVPDVPLVVALMAAGAVCALVVAAVVIEGLLRRNFD